MKRITGILGYVFHFLFKVFSFLIFSFAFFFFLFLLLSFFLFVTIKTNPDYARNIIQKSFTKVIGFANIKVDSINTIVKDERILIIMENFRTIKHGIKIYGDTLSISLSLDGIFQGKVYNIKINNFIIDARMHDEIINTDGQYSISSLYSILPSLHILINNFIFRIHDTNVIKTQNTSLFLNYGKYILFIKTESIVDDYNLKIFLTSNVLRLSFQNIPDSLFHKQTEEKYDFLQFKNVSGFFEYNTQNFADLKYHIVFSELKVDPNKYISSKIEFNKIIIAGYKNEDSFFMKIPESVMQGDGKFSTEIFLNNNTYDISVDVESIPLEMIKKLIPFNFIKGTKFESFTNYLMQSLSNGLIKKTNAKVHYPIKKQEDLSVFVDFEGVDMQYNCLFAEIKNANGFVKVNSENTEVFVKNANFVGNEMKNSSANIHNDIIDVDLHTSGNINSIVQTFFPSKEINLEKLVYGDSQLDTNISIDIGCGDIFKCVSFKGNIQMQNLVTVLNDDVKSKSIINFEKFKNSTIVNSNILLKNFQNSIFSLNALNLHTNINISSKKVLFSGDVIDFSSQKILSVNKVELDLSSDGVKISEIDVPLTKFGNNNFIFLWKKNNFLLKGESINIPVITEIINKFRSNIKEKVVEKSVIRKIFPENLIVNIDINKVYLFNNITTPIVMQMNIVKNTMENLFVRSELLDMNYFRLSSRSLLHNNEMYVKVQSIPHLLNGFSQNINTVKNGDLFLQGIHKDSTTVWFGLMRNLDTNVHGFSLNPKKVKITGTLNDDHTIKYSNIKMRDNKHTLFITGMLNTQTFITDTKIFYTPSTIEVLNEVPLLKDVLKVTTLGSSKNGLVSFEILAQGSIFSPTILFNKSSSVKSLWKFSAGVLLIPLLLL